MMRLAAPPWLALVALALLLLALWLVRRRLQRFPFPDAGRLSGPRSWAVSRTALAGVVVAVSLVPLAVVGAYLLLVLGTGGQRPPILGTVLFGHGAAFLATGALASYLAQQLKRAGERLAISESDLQGRGRKSLRSSRKWEHYVLYRFNDLQSCPHRPSSVVFLRGGITEIHQQSIAPMLRQMPVVVFDHGSGGGVILLHDRAVVFGIELGG